MARKKALPVAPPASLGSLVHETPIRPGPRVLGFATADASYEDVEAALLAGESDDLAATLREAAQAARRFGLARLAKLLDDAEDIVHDADADDIEDVDEDEIGAIREAVEVADALLANSPRAALDKLITAWNARAGRAASPTLQVAKTRDLPLPDALARVDADKLGDLARQALLLEPDGSDGEHRIAVLDAVRRSFDA